MCKAHLWSPQLADDTLSRGGGFSGVMTRSGWAALCRANARGISGVLGCNSDAVCQIPVSGACEHLCCVISTAPGHSAAICHPLICLVSLVTVSAAIGTACGECPGQRATTLYARPSLIHSRWFASRVGTNKACGALPLQLLCTGRTSHLGFAGCVLLAYVWTVLVLLHRGVP